MKKSKFKVLVGFFGEDVHDVALEAETDGIAHPEVALHIDRRNDDDDVTVLRRDMQMDRRSHHFRDVDGSGYTAVLVEVFLIEEREVGSGSAGGGDIHTVVFFSIIAILGGNIE